MVGLSNHVELPGSCQNKIDGWNNPGYIAASAAGNVGTDYSVGRPSPEHIFKPPSKPWMIR